MRPGERLKQNLGLNAFPKVFYARIIGLAAYRVYFVFYDSRLPNINLTSHDAFRKEFAPVRTYR